MSKYRVYDHDNGVYLSPIIPNILEPVELTGVSTTSGSNEITVASTAGVFPGMGLAIPGVPRGAFVHAIKSATVIVAYAPVFADATGTWTVTAANANATASASSLKGYALGANPVPIPEPCVDGSTYRNSFSETGAAWSGYISRTSDAVTVTRAGQSVAGQSGILIVPDALSTLATGSTSGGVIQDTSQVIGASSMTVAVSDEKKGTPPRPVPKWTSYYYLIATAGALGAKIRAAPNTELVRIGADA